MSVVALQITAHIENQGDVLAYAPQQFVGTKGQSRRVEGFSIAPSPTPGVDIEYMAHLEGSGDTHWHRAGQFVGTRGQGRRLEGFAIRLSGYAANQYDVKYYAHVQDRGDTHVASNGEFIGSRGQSKRVEGMAAWLEQRASYTVVTPVYVAPPTYPVYQPAPPAPSPVQYTPPVVVPVYHPVTYNPPASYPPPSACPVPVYVASAPSLQVTAIPQGLGAVTVFGQQYAGTKGQSRILEAFQISHTIPGLDVDYMAHIENKGDTHWHRNGHLVGHPGSNKRIEGFAVRLSGPAAASYDVKYYGHIQDQGDSPVGCNGSFVGTRGQSKRLEGLAVWLEPRHPGNRY